MPTTDPADLPDLDRVRGEMSRPHERAPVTGRTEHDRLADVRPDLAERLARLEAEMRDLDRASNAGPRPYIAFEPGGLLEPGKESS